MTTRRNARYTPIQREGPLPWQMIASLRAIQRDPLAFLERLVHRYGDVVALPLSTPVVLLNDPAGVQRVLLDNANNYTKDTIQYGSLSAVTGAGLLTSDGPAWRSHRRIAQPAFHPGQLDRVADEAVAAGLRISRAWAASPAETVVDLDPVAMQATLEIVGHTLFRADLESAGQRLVAAVGTALHGVVSQAQTPWPARLRPLASRRQRRAIAVLDHACAELVATRRGAGVQLEDRDLLAVLLRSADTGELTDRQVRDELVTMVIAGHETVASALTWTLQLLAQHERIQDQVAAELAAVLGDRPATRGDLTDLTVTRSVVAESLRLYPPAWVVTRRSVAADEVAGVALPAGTLVIMSPWLLHRREQAWPDPLRFSPERFQTEGDARPRSDYLPFGAGPRLCIGRDFALIETVLLVATVLQRHRVSLPAGAVPARVQALVTLRPRDGLPLVVAPRPGFMMGT